MRGLGGRKRCKYYNTCGSTLNCKRCDELVKKYKNKNKEEVKR